MERHNLLFTGGFDSTFRLCQASIFHITLSWEQIVVASLLTFIALMCAPGIIGGTLMDCAITWSAIGIPIEAIAYIAGIDYVIDVIRTVLNI